MGIEADMVTYLLAQTPLTAQIGTRLHAMVRPQRHTTSSTIYPAITWQRVGGTHEHHLTAAAGYAEMRIQFDIWSLSYLTCAAVGELLRAELSGFGPGTMGSSTVHGVLLESQLDFYEQPETAEEKGIYRRMQEYEFAFSESVPTF